jgi:hypothetical protein
VEEGGGTTKTNKKIQPRGERGKTKAGRGPGEPPVKGKVKEGKTVHRKKKKGAKNKNIR